MCADIHVFIIYCSNSFNIHGYGVNSYTSESLELRSDIEDRIHFFTEETDHLQVNYWFCFYYN